jgi:serine/threonine-protein kinase TTK/MPS1
MVVFCLCGAVRGDQGSGLTMAAPRSASTSTSSSLSSSSECECETEQLDDQSSNAPTVTVKEGVAAPTAAACTPSSAVAGGSGRKKRAQKEEKEKEKELESKKKRRVSFVDSTEEDEGGGDKKAVARDKKRAASAPSSLKQAAAGDDDNDDLSISLKPTAKRSRVNKSSSRRSGSGSGAMGSCQELWVNDSKYIQLDGVIGRGASSSVCRVLSLATSEIYAFKRVDVRNGSAEDADEVLESYTNEINLLRQCKGSPYIIDLIEHEVNREQMFVAMVMEMGELDLATALLHQKKLYAADHPRSSKVDPFFMRLAWQRMLLAVDYLHDHRIVHGDLKPANFVFVKGQLKLIDFGISREISGDTTNIVRTGIIGTVNYMAPEAVMPSSIPSAESRAGDTSNDDDDDQEQEQGGRGEQTTVIKHGRASDIWSLGCILYQMLYGKTPFSSCRNPHQKIVMIANPKAEIPFDPISETLGVQVAKACLVRDVTKRATIRGASGLLAHPFLTSHLREKSEDAATETSDLPGCSTVSELPTAPSHKESSDQAKSSGGSSGGISLCQVRKIVQTVLDSSEDLQTGKIGKENLCQQVMLFSATLMFFNTLYFRLSPSGV